MPLDILAFAAHPDDVEIFCGGTLAKMAALGRKVGACELTRGEMGTLGDPDTRAKECADAAKILGLAERINLGIPDSSVANTPEQQLKLVEVIRKHKPRVVILPSLQQRHPDHMNTAIVGYDACYLAGLKKFHTGEPHRPHKILWSHWRRDERPPTFVVDIGDQIEAKMSSIGAHKSQFPRDNGRWDWINDWVRVVARHYGMMIGKKYGEGFTQREPHEVADLTELPVASI